MLPTEDIGLVPYFSGYSFVSFVISNENMFGVLRRQFVLKAVSVP